MTPTPIGEHGFLSDCRTTALISAQGGVEWWCVPRLDSPSVFGRLLDPDAGHWDLAPVDPCESTRAYLDRTLLLETHYTGADGAARVTDGLVFEPGARGHDIGLRSPRILVRRIEGLRGRLRFRTEFAPRPEYGLITPAVRVQDGTVVVTGGPVTLRLASDVALRCDGTSACAEFDVSAGQSVTLRLAYEPAYGLASVADLDGEQLLADTAQGWRSWVATHPGVPGPYRRLIEHSSLVLQGLTFAPSGALAAAATTSLPEQLGGPLNWDYRFAWLRDLGLTLHALWVAACPDEADRLFRWIARSLGRLGDEPVAVMFGLEGERVHGEQVLAHLTGYAASAPVRIGNAAAGQRQLDIPGEVLDAAHRLRAQLDLDDEMVHLLVSLADRACTDWRRPDAGMWEPREDQRHHLASKVYCWVALDRALALADDLGPAAHPEKWQTSKDQIRAEVLEHGWNHDVGAYTGAFGHPDLDASVLILPLVGFLEAADPRMWATIEAVEYQLGHDGAVHRWAGDPAGFILCNFWLVECLARGGAVQRAERWFDRTVGVAGELGLLAEQVDGPSRTQLGNFPQAFSHMGLINAAWQLTEASKAPGTT